MKFEDIEKELAAVPEYKSPKRDASFPKVWMSKFAEGEYTLRFLPSDPTKNPKGCVIQKVIEVWGDRSRPYGEKMPDPTYGHDVVTSSPWVEQLRKLMRECPTRGAFSKDLSDWAYRLQTKKTFHFPVIVEVTVKSEAQSNGYSNDSYSQGKTPVGVVLQVDQKGLTESILDQLKAWGDPEVNIDVCSESAGIYFRLKKVDKKTYKFEAKAPSVPCAMPEMYRKLYSEGKYPEVEARARKEFKPSAEVIQKIKNCQWAVEELKTHGIFLNGDTPVASWDSVEDIGLPE